MIIGLVGKPSSGKSSFFKAATMADVKISPVPFTTIKPNMGVGYATIDCVHKEFGHQCSPRTGACVGGKRFIPVNMVDVAGLVPGAHEGRGLGNKFLDDLRQASALIHIVDASGTTDESGNPTEGRDPEGDIKFLEQEIDLWFQSIIQKSLPKIERARNKFEIIDAVTDQMSGLGVARASVEEALTKHPDIKSLEFATELRKLSKPLVIAANKIDMDQSQKNLENLKKIHPNVVPASAESEIVLKRAGEMGLVNYDGRNFDYKGQPSEAQKAALDRIKRDVIEKYGSTGVQDCINTTVFSVLNHVAVYPVADSNKLSDKEGRVLPDVFLVPKGTTVKGLAYKVHSTLGDKFIAGVDARTKKRLAADYEVKNNDVIEIMFSK